MTSLLKQAQKEDETIDTNLNNQGFCFQSFYFDLLTEFQRVTISGTGRTKHSKVSQLGLTATRILFDLVLLLSDTSTWHCSCRTSKNVRCATTWVNHNTGRCSASSVLPIVTLENWITHIHTHTHTHARTHTHTHMRARTHARTHKQTKSITTTEQQQQQQSKTKKSFFLKQNLIN